jgi:hypothetical protein
LIFGFRFGCCGYIELEMNTLNDMYNGCCLVSLIIKSKTEAGMIF